MCPQMQEKADNGEGEWGGRKDEMVDQTRWAGKSARKSGRPFCKLK